MVILSVINEQGIQMHQYSPSQAVSFMLILGSKFTTNVKFTYQIRKVKRSAHAKKCAYNNKS